MAAETSTMDLDFQISDFVVDSESELGLVLDCQCSE